MPAKQYQKLKFEIDTSPLKEIEKDLANALEFIQLKNQIIRQICSKIQPMVQRFLVEALKSSGLKSSPSAELEKWVSRSIVYPTTRGIKIGPPRNLSQDEYKKMGALQYGYMKNLTGITKPKSRQKIKQAAEKVHSVTGSKQGPGGSKFVEAHPYYNLSDSHIKQIEQAINDEMQNEYVRFLSTKK